MSLGTTKYHLDAAEAPAFIAARGARPVPPASTARRPHGATPPPHRSRRRSRTAARLRPRPRERRALRVCCKRPADHGVDRRARAPVSQDADRQARARNRRPRDARARRRRPTRSCTRPSWARNRSSRASRSATPTSRTSCSTTSPAASSDHATVHGLRIEHDPAPPPSAPSGRRYPIALHYRLADTSEQWTHWRPARQLVRWEPVSLGAFAGEKRLAQVWWALRQARPLPTGPRAPTASPTP